jgi:hypothetical protein
VSNLSVIKLPSRLLELRRLGRLAPPFDILHVAQNKADEIVGGYWGVVPQPVRPFDYFMLHCLHLAIPCLSLREIVLHAPIPQRFQ